MKLSTALQVSESLDPPYQDFNLNPQKMGGLWLAVIITPPTAWCSTTASDTDGVGVGAGVRITWNPFPTRTSAVSRAKRSAKNRRSNPTIALSSRPWTGDCGRWTSDFQ